MLCRFEDAFLDGGVYLLHHGKQVQAYFVAGIFVLQIGAVRHVGLPDTFQITDDFLSVQAEQGADYMSVSGAYAPQPVDAGTANQIEQQCLYTVILMVGDGNDSCTACFPCFFEPRVAQFPCSHFDGDMPFLCFLLRVEVDGVQRHPVLQAELAYKVLVAVGFRSAQMEVAMGGFACVSQAEEQAQQRHGVRPAAQCHKYLVVQREELVALDVLYYLLHIQL